MSTINWSERRIPRFSDTTMVSNTTTTTNTDTVNKPPHYNTGKLECIDAIEASMSYSEFNGYLKGNALKYLWRYNYKGKPIEDLQKAQWYLNKLIACMKKAV